MKKLVFILSILLFLVSCSKSSEAIKESISKPTLTKLKATIDPQAIFLLNDTLENHLKDFTIYATYSDGTLKEITPTKVIFTGFNTKTLGEKIITIKIDNVSTEIKYTVFEYCVKSLSVSLKPNIFICEGMPLSYFRDNVVLEAKCSDEITRIITVTDDMIHNFNTEKMGSNSVLITYSNKSVVVPLEIKERHTYFKVPDSPFKRIVMIYYNADNQLRSFCTNEKILLPVNKPIVLKILFDDMTGNIYSVEKTIEFYYYGYEGYYILQQTQDDNFYPSWYPTH